MPFPVEGRRLRAAQGFENGSSVGAPARTPHRLPHPVRASPRPPTHHGSEGDSKEASSGKARFGKCTGQGEPGNIAGDASDGGFPPRLLLSWAFRPIPPSSRGRLSSSFPLSPSSSSSLHGSHRHGNGPSSLPSRADLLLTPFPLSFCLQKSGLRPPSKFSPARPLPCALGSDFHALRLGAALPKTPSTCPFSALRSPDPGMLFRPPRGSQDATPSRLSSRDSACPCPLSLVAVSLLLDILVSECPRTDVSTFCSPGPLCVLLPTPLQSRVSVDSFIVFIYLST